MKATIKFTELEVLQILREYVLKNQGVKTCGLVKTNISYRMGTGCPPVKEECLESVEIEAYLN